MRRMMVGLMTASSLGSPALAAAPGWVISEASQGVMIAHAGMVKVAVRGGRAEAGDIITTGANARAVLVRGEEYAVVAPNSRLQLADPAASGGLTQFFEKIGNVVYSVKKMASPHFGVQTPYLAAVVKGTTFSVTVDDAGASVQVVEGAVEVATGDGGARELLRPGAIASVAAGDLGTLTVQGSTTRTIHSNGPAAAAATGRTIGPAIAPSEPAAATLAAPVVAVSSPVATVTPSQDGAGNAARPASIGTIVEAPAPLANLTGGLVSGQGEMQMAVATASTSGADHAVAAATDKPTALVGGHPEAIGGAAGSGSSNAGGNGNGNGGSNAGGNGNGNGNSNAGGNGNGNGNSNAGGNGNGNGNSNAGGNGNGNGNSNAGGNGNGNGNSNAGGNGNGNGNSNAGGNGNGNGNSNAGGNGNANGNSNAGGNGNGNGNSNAGGNGNGNGNSNAGGNGNGNGNSNAGGNGNGNGTGNGNSNAGGNGNGNGNSNAGGNGNGTTASGTDNGVGNGGVNNGNGNGNSGSSAGGNSQGGGKGKG